MTCVIVSVNFEQQTYQEIPRLFYSQSVNYFTVHSSPVLEPSTSLTIFSLRV